MPEDQTDGDGTSKLPQADFLTPMRVECFIMLVSPNLATRAAMIPNTMVEVYPVQGGRVIIPFHEVTTHATIEVHPSFSQALSFRSSVPHPKPHVEKNEKCNPINCSITL